MSVTSYLFYFIILLIFLFFPSASDWHTVPRWWTRCCTGTLSYGLIVAKELSSPMSSTSSYFLQFSLLSNWFFFLTSLSKISWACSRSLCQRTSFHIHLPFHLMYFLLSYFPIFFLDSPSWVRSSSSVLLLLSFILPLLYFLVMLISLWLVFFISNVMCFYWSLL